MCFCPRAAFGVGRRPRASTMGMPSLPRTLGRRQAGPKTAGGTDSSRPGPGKGGRPFCNQFYWDTGTLTGLHTGYHSGEPDTLTIWPFTEKVCCPWSGLFAAPSSLGSAFCFCTRCQRLHVRVWKGNRACPREGRQERADVYVRQGRIHKHATP